MNERQRIDLVKSHNAAAISCSSQDVMMVRACKPAVSLDYMTADAQVLIWTDYAYYAMRPKDPFTKSMRHVSYCYHSQMAEGYSASPQIISLAGLHRFLA